jgi:hypothetical protein
VPAPKQNTERDQAIAARARLGQSHDSLAAEYGLTRQRVSQIVAAANPHSPEEAQRQAIAERLRSRWDELEKIVRRPPVKTTSIGRTQYDPRTCTCGVKAATNKDHDPACQVEPVLEMSAVVSAIKAQLAIEAQYRQMFGCDLGTRPGPLLDEAHLIMRAEITVARQYMDRRAPAVPIAPLPLGYHALPPEEQMQIQLGRGRDQVEAQRAVLQGQIES